MRRLLLGLLILFWAIPVAAKDHPSRAIGLSVVTDWSTQAPFIDLMKTARPWFGHLPGSWGGVSNEDLRAAKYLDDNGWPVAIPPEVGSVGTLILTDIPTAAKSLAGRYVLRFEGKGIVEAKGRASNQRYGENEVRFDYTPGEGPVEIRIQRSNRADPVRNISVVREDHAGLHARGQMFNPDWTDRLAPFGALRFMDWMNTNDSLQGDWATRPKPQDATWADKGVPLEVMIALANELQKDPWFNIPHLADDAYVQSFAQMVRDGLDPSRRVYVEYSNEVWNWQFEQTRWADAQAKTRWSARDAGHQFYALRAAEVARIWSDVFKGQEDRLVNVISTQTGWIGLEQDILNAPLVRSDGRPAPFEAFDAYAITGYFGGIIGTQERSEMVDGWIAQGMAAATDLAAREVADGSVSGDKLDTIADLVDRVWPYHASVAQEFGLDLIMYEGGSHIVGLGPRIDDEKLTRFFHHLNYSAEMGDLYRKLLKGWQDVGGQMFNAYADVYAPTKWGSWGHLRHLDDENPRWNALVETR